MILVRQRCEGERDLMSPLDWSTVSTLSKTAKRLKAKKCVCVFGGEECMCVGAYMYM